MSLDREKLDLTIRHVVDLLAARNFGELEAVTDSIRMRSEEMAAAVETYPGDVISVLRSEDLNVIQIDTPIEECWSVNVRLHTDQEGPSDQILSLTIVQDESDKYRVELDGIHVL